MMITRLFKALSDPSRLRALAALQDRELCVCQIIELLGLAPSTVSKHMSVLSTAGLVDSSKKGRWVYYRLATETSPQIRGVLEVLPQLMESETQISKDHHSLTQILNIDPETLCQKQSERT